MEKAKIVQNVRQGDHPDTEMPAANPESGTKPIPNQQENSRKKSKSELLDRLVSVECMGKDKVTLGWFDARIESYHKGLGYFLRH